MQTGVESKNWRGGFIPLLPKQEGLVNYYLLIIYIDNRLNSPPITMLIVNGSFKTR